MKKKYFRIFGVALTLVLLASLFGFATPVSAANVGWSGIVNPGNILATGLNLADVEVGPIAVTPDGNTIFAAVQCEADIAGVGNVTIGRPWALLQSADGGHNWTGTGLIMNIGVITGIAISSNFATDGTMYVAAWSGTLGAPAVFRSQNSGRSFVELKGIPADANGNATTAINSIAMWPASPYAYVMVGTNTDVWVLQDAPFGIWMDQQVNAVVAVGIVDVAFAPDFATTNYIWAVTVSGLITCTNSPGAWGTLLGNGGVLSLPDIGDIITLTAGGVGATVTPVISSGAATVAPTPIVLGAAATATITATAVNTTVGFLLTAGGVTAGVTTDANGNASAGVTSADMDFADDYSSATSPYVWVGTNCTGFAAPLQSAGGVFRVRGLPGVSQSIQQVFSTATVNNDIRSIAVSGPMGSAAIIAGRQNTATVTGSLNGGLTWALPVFKQPTGVNTTYVVMAPDFATSSVAYVGTSDAGVAGTVEPGATASAFQVSGNGGMSWNQTGLIDTIIADIVDVAVVSLDTIFMVTSSVTVTPAANFSLWKTEDATAAAPVWERILTARTGIFPANALLAAPTTIDFVVASPDFLTDGVLYVANAGTGITKSTDGGNIFAPMGPPGAAITALHVVDATFAFIGAVNNVYRTDDGAYSWIASVVAPVGTVVSIATSPDYATDGTLLVGTNAGTVYRSVTRGITWAIVGTAIAGVTNTFVAFDPGYATNSTVYAGGDAVIARYNFALPTVPWTPIDLTIPTGVAVPGAAGDAFSIMAAVPTSGFIQVAPDTITFTGSGAAADAGTITVTAGSVTVATTGTATIGATATLGIIVVADGAVAFTTPSVVAGADTVVISATTTATTGTWAITGGAPTAAVTLDRDGDSAIAAAPGAWNLVDAFTGTISVTTTGAATYVAASGAYTIPGAGDIVTATATTANTTGCWTITAGAGTAAITSDADGDATVTLAAGAFSLPDSGVAAGVGASVINGLVTSPDGTLYGSNALVGQGMERSLNPTAVTTRPVEGWIAPVFERATSALAATAAFNGLWLRVDETLAVTGSKNVFFSINTAPAQDQIMTYTDTLATPVVSLAPEEGAVFPREAEVTMEWEALTGARSYHWQIARDAAFRLMADEDVSGYTTDTSVLLGPGRTYYWRVRVAAVASLLAPAGSPVLSRWSETRTFTTLLGARPWHPFSNIGGVAPAPGAQDVLTKPAFQWNGADWATSYQLMLADNADFTGATTKTLTTTSWVSDTDLGYSTTWYWKVIALSATSESEWSDVGVFTTMAEPAPPVVVEEVQPPVIEVIIPEAPAAVEVTPVAPGYLLAIIIIGAVLVIFVIVLIVRTRRPI